MTTAATFRAGAVYYALFFHDPQRRFPDISARVYLGQGLEHNRETDHYHYFQTVASYFHDGPWTEMDRGRRQSLAKDCVILVAPDALELNCDLPELIARLERMASRGNDNRSA
jgi:hypothetical protein